MAQVIIRVASRDIIKEDYLSSQITFSCPANWHNYAIKYGNNTIGDQLECVYAHLPIGDPRIEEMDYEGKSMGDNLTMLVNQQRQSVYLRHEPVLLTPALCFFQFEVDRDSIIENNGLRFCLDKYCDYMKYKLEDVYFLIIHSAKEFEEDLQKNVPLAVKENEELLISDGSGGYVQGFDGEKPINYCAVDYDKHNYKEFFYEKNEYRKEMWWKAPEYRDQSEGRIVIKGVHFRQKYSGVDKYEYSKNLLKVRLPNMRNYTSIVDGNKYNWLDFYIDQDNNIKIKAAYINFK